MNSYSDSYADAIDPRCTPIGGHRHPERDNPNPMDERCRLNYRPGPIPSDSLEEGWRYGPNGELLAPGEPDPPIIPEEVDD